MQSSVYTNTKEVGNECHLKQEEPSECILGEKRLTLGKTAYEKGLKYALLG